MPARHHQVSAIFLEALEVPLAQRAQFLHKICGSDEELLREVQSLLDAHEQAGSYFDIPAVGVAARLLAEKDSLAGDATAGSLVGRRLKQYEFLSRIGVGGMGEVYRAHDRNLGRDVAIKVLSPEFSADPKRIAHLRTEARTLATLNHPCIGAIHDVQEEDGLCGLVRELVEGDTLAERIARSPLSSDETLSIAKQVADALTAAHGKGIVHRDLKPANIKITPEGRVKVLDFGLAKLTVPESPGSSVQASLPTLSSASDAIIGTPSYMSPEQARGEPPNVRTDIWAFGCVLYEMLSGKRAFKGETTTEVLATVIDRDPDWSALPRSAARARSLAQRCLQKDSTRRIPNMVRVQAELESLTATNRSNRRLGLAAAVLGILVALGLVYGLVSGRSSGTKPPNRSLAVLPLVDRSALGEESGSFADGMTEELSGELGRFRDLRVISSRMYKGTQKTLREIARDLKVDFLLEGSVERSHGQVLIHASLFEAAEDRQLWSDSYQRDYQDVLTLRRGLARDIALQINLKLTPEDENRMAGGGKVIPEAYQAYLEGLKKLDSRDPSGVIVSMDKFERAIEIDPGFGPAHAGLAKTYANMGFNSVMLPAEAYPLAKEEAQKALILDPSNEDARITLVRIRVDQDWDFNGAEGEYKQLIEKNPNNVSVYAFYTELLVALGRFDDALVMNRRSIELDPQSVDSAQREGWIQYMARKPEASIAGWKKALELNPSGQLIFLGLGDASALAAKDREAFGYYQQYLAAGLTDEKVLSAQAKAYQSGGLDGYTRKWLARTEEEESGGDFIWTYNRAKLHARVGNRKEALIWLGKAFQEHHNRLIYLKVEPDFEKMRSEPEYLNLMRKVGLPL